LQKRCWAKGRSAETTSSVAPAGACWSRRRVLAAHTGVSRLGTI